MKSRVVLLLLALTVPLFAGTSQQSAGGHTFALMTGKWKLANSRGTAQQSSSFDSVAFLVGKWKPSNADASPTVFHPAMDGQAIVGEKRSPDKREDTTAKQRDLLVIFKDTNGQRLRAIQLDSQGKAIHYSVTATGQNQVTFMSENASGPRYRLSYKLDADETLRAELDVARDGAGFKPHLRWTAHRVEQRGWL